MHSPSNSPATAESDSGVMPPAEAPVRQSNVGLVVIFCIALCALGFVVWNILRNDSGPSLEKAREAFAAKVGSESGGEIWVDGFLKTDGQMAEIGGVKLYTLKFRAFVRFRHDGTWFTRESFNTQDVTYRFERGKSASGAISEMMGARKVSFVNVATITGSAIGEKTESGWNFKIGNCQLEP